MLIKVDDAEVEECQRRAAEIDSELAEEIRWSSEFYNFLLGNELECLEYELFLIPGTTPGYDSILSNYRK